MSELRGQGSGMHLFCELDHSESQAGKENCGNARKVRQGWLTSQALSSPAVNKKKTKKQKQRNSTGDSGFCSEAGRDRKYSPSSITVGPIT